MRAAEVHHKLEARRGELLVARSLEQLHVQMHQADLMREAARDMLLLHLRELEDRVRAGDTLAWQWGQINVHGRELPLDDVACDWLDANPWPPGWLIVRRPRNR